ncbi:MAG TPA: hypothetical protein VK856_00860, partial [Anaerolineaceae bacterium]|nr:hypothetical protein [Anaerolineaceae bacterium]
MLTKLVQENRIEKSLFVLFQFLISILFSIILTGQVFGILKIYNFVIVVPSTIILTILFFWVWQKNNKFQITTFPLKNNSPSNSQNYKYLSLATYLLSLFLLLLIIIPILNWPNNTMEKELNWDAGEYHFPKAIEQYRSGSAWDFSISYGEYPFGYESLLSFDLLLTNDLSLFSTSHVLITLLFVFSSWFLLKKYSKFPPAILLLTFIFLLLSGFLPFFNPWSSLRYTIFTIGKNDLFLAAATIAAIYFSQIRKPKEETQIDWIGLGLSSSIALSIKPNSIFVIIFLWVISIYKGWGFKLKNL